MSFAEITRPHPRVGVVTLNRPDRMNAMAFDVMIPFREALQEVGNDNEVRIVVVTGAGRGFCSGADHENPGTIPHIEGLTLPTIALRSMEMLDDVIATTRRLHQPVIAAVNGAAVGGGFAFALACDIRYASPGARFGAVFITRGVSACDMGTSYFLPRLVGASRAAELMLTGRVFGAPEAREMGLVLDVVDDGNVVGRALETARLIAANPPLAVWMTKETMWQTIDAPSFRHALDMENRTQVMCTATGELTEAFAAFREGRPARWKPL